MNFGMALRLCVWLGVSAQVVPALAEQRKPLRQLCSIPDPQLPYFLMEGSGCVQEKRAAFARQMAGQRARGEEARAAWEKERATLEAETTALQVSRLMQLAIVLLASKLRSE